MTEGKDHLSALPNELLASVVEQLPVQEICRLRSISRHFRDFVDTNQGHLTRDLVTHHHARINDEYKLLTDLSDCDIVDALRRYDSHYGFAVDGRITRSCVFKFESVPATLGLNWIRSRRFPAADQDDFYEAGHWIQAYSDLSSQMGLEPRNDNLSEARVGTSHMWLSGSNGFNALRTKLAEVTSTRIDAAYSVVPFYFLTKRKVFRHDEKTRKGLCKHPEMSKLERLLGLPELDHIECPLAYCSMAESTAQLVRKVDQGPSTRLKEAAIIEKIFIW
jgi:hypothetical protein